MNSNFKDFKASVNRTVQALTTDFHATVHAQNAIIQELRTTVSQNCRRLRRISYVVSLVESDLLGGMEFEDNESSTNEAV
jgi:hypothetical protein